MEDRRRSGSGKQLAVAGGGLGLILLVVLGLLAGEDPAALLGQVVEAQAEISGRAGGAARGGGRELSAEELETGEFVATVLADTEDVWKLLFNETLGRRYRNPTLVLFRDAVQSACGSQDSAVGPFYCPGDSKIYIDVDFFRTLAGQLEAPGDFAQAYVIAHEVGHHVQNLLGITNDVRNRQSGVSEEQASNFSVRLELQADFLAGLWAHHAELSKQFLEEGDIEEALRAASQIGDDTLQRRAQGRVMPESFTHGTAEQRVRWFRLGFETGDLNRMDTFAVPRSQL